MSEQSNDTENISQVSGEVGGEATAAQSTAPAQEATGEHQTTEKSVTGGADQASEGTLLASIPGASDESTETEAEAEAKADGAPEAYEEFKAPEGVSLDATAMSAFGEVAKELNLSQEKAQSVIDKMGPILAQRQMEQIKEVTAAWREKSANDPEIGGVNLEKNLVHAARIRDKFAYNADGKIDADIAELMNSPAGNHPGLLKLLIRTGKAFGEGGFPKGQPTKPKFTASDLYRKTKGE